MAMTPDDVRTKTFTPVRLREGYDMGEVDKFLDEVEEELIRIHADNDDVRTKLAAAQSAGRPATGGTEAALPAVKTVPEAASAAARLLEIAAENADQLVGEAQDSADKIVGEARTKAERLESDAKANAERLEADARGRVEQMDEEASQHHEQVLGELERTRDSLTTELEDLRAFEREYRSRLKGYFESQLRTLDGEPDEAAALTPSQDGDTPPRLAELLGEEQPR